MARKNRENQSDFPYHICARVSNSEWFPIPLSDVWEIFEDQLFFIYHAYGVRIHSFVLMSNHFHLLASTPNGNLSEAMRWLMTETSREIGFKSNRRNHIWGSRHHATVIRDLSYWSVVYRYVYTNPTTAGVCSKVEDYPYSTLSRILGSGPIRFPVEEDTLLFDGHKVSDSILHWLNSESPREFRSQITKGLRWREFRVPIDRTTRRPTDAVLSVVR